MDFLRLWRFQAQGTNFLDRQGQNLLMRYLKTARPISDVHVIQLIRLEGNNVNHIDSRYGKSPLICAVENRTSTYTTFFALHMAGADFSYADNRDQKNALMLYLADMGRMDLQEI